MWTASALTWPPACAVIQRGSRWRRRPSYTTSQRTLSCQRQAPVTERFLLQRSVWESKIILTLSYGYTQPHCCVEVWTKVLNNAH